MTVAESPVRNAEIREQPVRIGRRRGGEFVNDDCQLRLRKAIEDEMSHNEIVMIAPAAPNS